MSIFVRPMVLALGLLVSSCNTLQAAETLPEPLTGQVKPACGPADGPALDFSLETDDRQTTLSFYLWQSLPAEPMRLPIRRSGLDTFQGELCQTGNCQSIERLGMSLDPTQPGLVVGTLTLRGEQGTSLRAEFRADWSDRPGLICG